MGFLQDYYESKKKAPQFGEGYRPPTGTVPTSELMKAPPLKTTTTPESTKEVAPTTEEPSEGFKTTIRFGSGLLEELSFGGMTRKFAKESPEMQKEYEEQIKGTTAFKWGQGIGMAGTSLIGGGIVAKGAKAGLPLLKSLPKIGTKLAGKLGGGLGAKAVGKAAEYATTEAIAESGISAARSIGKGETFKEGMKRQAWEVPLAAAGAGLFGAGEEVAKPFIGRLKDARKLKQIDKAYEGMKGVPIAKDVTDIKPPISKVKPIKEINYKDIKTAEQLPIDDAGLENYIKQVEQAKKKGFKFDLQLFAEAQKRLETSKMQKSLSKSTIVKSKESQDFIDDFDFSYEKKTNADTVDKAIENLENDYMGTKERLVNKGIDSSEDTAAAGIIMSNLEDEARKTGDYTGLKSFIEKVRPQYTEMGQAIQAIRTWVNKTGSGSIMKAQGLFDNVIKKSKNLTKYKDDLNKVKGVVEDIKDKQGQIIDESVDEIIKDVDEVIPTPKKPKAPVEPRIPKGITDFGEMLQKKISTSLKPKGKKERSLVKEIINDLFAEAKETLPPKAKPGAKVSSTQKLAESYKYTKWGRAIRRKSQALLKEEFKDNKEMLKILDDYFQKNKRPSNKKILDKVLRERITGLQPSEVAKLRPRVQRENIKNWVKDWYKTGRESKERFIDKIIEETGLSGDDANSLRNTLESRLKAEVKATKDKLLDAVMKPKTKVKEGKKAAEKLTELVNIGLLENKKFTDRINEKISPLVRKLLKENNINLSDVVKATVKDRRISKGQILRDVFRGAKVDDIEANKLIKLVGDEFDKLTKEKRDSMIAAIVKPKKEAVTKSAIEKLIEKINLGVYDDTLDSALADAVKAKYDLPYLDGDDVKYIMDSYDKLGKLDPTSREFKELSFDVNNRITSKLPTDITQKFSTLQRLTFLTNPKSILKSISNISRGMEYLTGTITEPALDWLTTGFKKNILKQPDAQREVFFPKMDDFRAVLKGFGKGGKDVLQDMRTYKDTSRMQNIMSTKFMRTKPFSDKTAWNRFLNKVDFQTGKLYDLFDRPFTDAIYEGRIRQIMRANKVTEPTPNMIEEAIEYAEEVMGVHDSMVSQWFNGMKRFSFGKDKPAINTAYKMTMQYLLPFVRFMGNDAVKSVDYAGGSIFRAMYHLQKGQQKEFLKHANRAFYGTFGLTALGVILAKNGYILDPTVDSKKAETFKKQIGKRPGGIKAGDKTFDISWMGSGASPILEGARLYHDSGESETVLDEFLEYSKAPAKSTLELGPARKLKSLMMTEDPITELTYGTARDIAGYIPTPIKMAASVMDPYERETMAESKTERIMNTFKRNIPGLRQTLPIRRDVFGKPVESYGKGGKGFVDIFSITDIKDDKTTNEIDRLIDEGFSKHVPPSTPNKISTGKRDKKGKLIYHQMTAEDRSAYAKEYGKRLESKYKAVMRSSEYKRTKDDEKESLLSSAASKVGTQTREWFQENKLK